MVKYPEHIRIANTYVRPYINGRGCSDYEEQKLLVGNCFDSVIKNIKNLSDYLLSNHMSCDIIGIYGFLLGKTSSSLQLACSLSTAYAN